jgi:hypothetical protein
MQGTRAIGALFLTIAIAACDSQVASPRGDTAKLRLVHSAASSAVLDLKVDGQIVLQDVAATQISGYAEVNAGTRTIAVTLGQTGATLVSESAVLEKDEEYTLLISGTLANPEYMIASDTAFSPLPTKVKIRVIHAARNAPPLDVYLTAPGADLGSASKLVEPFAFNVADTSSFPSFVERDPGDWQVRFTDDGTTNVVLDTGPFSAVAGQIITVVLSHDANENLVTRLVDETPGVEPERVFIRVSHAAPSLPIVAVHITPPGLDLNEPHLFIAPFQHGFDSSTVTFMLPPNNQNTLDLEVRFTDLDNINVLATSGPFNVPLGERRKVTLQPKQGGGVEVVVTNEP